MLDKLRLVDFGGFEDTTLTFHPRVTVLIGRNGSGKSTVVTALRVTLSSMLRATGWFEPVKTPLIERKGPFWFPQDMDIRGTEAALALEVQIDGTTSRWVFERGEAPLEWAEQADVEVAEGASNLTAAANVLLCTASPRWADASEQNAVPRANAPTAAFTFIDSIPGRGTGLHWLMFWLRREENLENEIRLRDDPNHRRPQLQAVRQALTKFLNALGEAHYSDPRISRVDPSGEPWSDATDGRLVVDKDGETLAIEQLSDGEQLALLTVMDLARRLVMADPKRAKPLSGPGLVIIDEIELHLHPGWQRRILPALLETFEGLQFVVTTHSPQVVGSVEAECVRVLDRFQVFAASATLGRDSNSLLEDVFHVEERDPGFVAELDRIAQLIDDEDLEAAKEGIEQLSERLTDTDPGVAHLREMLTFMAS